MSEGDLLIKILGFVILVSQAVTAWAVLSGRSQKREITPQPFQVQAAHEGVLRPEFDKHVQEIWTVINGIRRDITEIREHIAAIRVLREDNGNRLGQLERDVKSMTGTMGELVQALHEHNKKA